jgi:putative Holliday junction resolvase
MAIDVGEKRIGVALANSEVRIAIAYGFIEVDGTELKELNNLIVSEKIDVLVVGLPRNQRGETTPQTDLVRAFAKNLELSVPKLVFQDESLTSLLAEERLKLYGKSYVKGDIDAEAATMILQDYLDDKA